MKNDIVLHTVTYTVLHDFSLHYMQFSWCLTTNLGYTPRVQKQNALSVLFTAFHAAT